MLQSRAEDEGDIQEDHMREDAFVGEVVCEA